MRVGPKAAKLYNKVAGKRIVVACGRVTDEPIAGMPFSTSGYGSSTVTLPRKRNRVFLLDSSGDADICTLSTREGGNDGCLPNSASDTKYCARVIVPVTDAGRKHLDAIAARWTCSWRSSSWGSARPTSRCCRRSRRAWARMSSSSPRPTPRRRPAKSASGCRGTISSSPRCSRTGRAASSLTRAA